MLVSCCVQPTCMRGGTSRPVCAYLWTGLSAKASAFPGNLIGFVFCRALSDPWLLTLSSPRQSEVNFTNLDKALTCSLFIFSKHVHPGQNICWAKIINKFLFKTYLTHTQHASSPAHLPCIRFGCWCSSSANFQWVFHQNCYQDFVNCGFQMTLP